MGGKHVWNGRRPVADGEEFAQPNVGGIFAPGGEEGRSGQRSGSEEPRVFHLV